MLAGITLTEHQKAIWLEDKLNIGKPIFNIGTYLELSDIPDVDLLQQSIRSTIKDHDALRILLREEKGYKTE